MTKYAVALLISIGFLLAACNGQPTAAGLVSASATANPALVATAQADQYWRDAQATSQAYQDQLEANYRNVQNTAVAATGIAGQQQAQATATAQYQQTADALTFAMTVGAATVQYQQTADAATAQASATATAQAIAANIATSTAAAQATADSFTATRQALELSQAEAEAQRARVVSAATTAFAVFAGVLFVGLTAWFFWKVAPTLVNRASLVRYGQHGNPLLLIARNGRTVIADPLRMLQASLAIDEQAAIDMPEVTPNHLQTFLAGGVLRTLIEQARHAPGHPAQLAAETVTHRRAGVFESTSTVRHTPPVIVRPAAPSLSASDTADSLTLPGSVSWQTLITQAGGRLALGMGQHDVIALDLARTPHILLSGSSGSGKTRRALRPLVAQALVRGVFVVLMNESGSDFSPFYDHPNAAIIRGDTAGYLTILEAANQEIVRREAILRETRVSEWQRLPAAFRDGPPLLLVIDELLSLASLMPSTDQRAFWGLLAAYASRARKLGMGSIGVPTDPTYRVLGAGLNWREQCTARISFKVAKSAVSRAILDTDGAESLADGQFLATLGRPGLVHGVAADPGDDELADYLAYHPAPALPRPTWLESNPGIARADSPLPIGPNVAPAEIVQLAETIRPAWEKGDSKRKMALAAGGEYAGAFATKIDRALNWLISATTATTTA